ncbi:hypothetical protein Q4551_15705 [Oceanobacter sp. 5_MG-2023]|uniref:hypothetical protein n=2 Tax=unclassified Oceanobacter TaxID=2620260 RepID=UPI0026E1F91D|nr:hypothetical protein [Oceanobacter sp. 5_MG-2023]MDO6683736.1 hypothetical protein [Oceanobacter sp. 5_MG-2023]
MPAAIPGSLSAVAVSQSVDWLDAAAIHSHDWVDLLVLPSLSLLVVDHRGSLAQLPDTIQQLIGLRQALRLHPDISRTFNLLGTSI